MKKKEEKLDVSKQVRCTGIVLIIMGLLHFAFPETLWAFFGIILITVGILSLIFGIRELIFVFGSLLVLIGVANIWASITSPEASIFWLIFGCFQIYWGIIEIKRFFKVDKKAKKYRPKEKIEGFGGWMIIPVLNLFVSIIASIYGLFTILVFPSLIGLGITIPVLIFMFQKKKTFPIYFITWLWISLVLAIIEAFIIEDYAYILPTLIFAIIWTSYMNVSVRVKNTFVK